MKFSLKRLVIRNLYHFRHANILIVLSVAITTMIIAGSLIIGDSIRYSLKNNSNKRLGKIKYILRSSKYDLGVENIKNTAIIYDNNISFLFSRKGSLITEINSNYHSDVNIYGVDKKFFDFSILNEKREIPDDSAFINSNTATQLNLKVNDIFTIEFPERVNYNMNSPFREKNNTIKIRLKVAGIISSGNFGDFSLKADNYPKFNIFFNKRILDGKFNKKGIFNYILFKGDKSYQEIFYEKIKSSFDLFTINGLSIRETENRSISELISDEVFIPDHIADSLEDIKEELDFNLSYLVNSISFQNKSSPYSFVAGVSHKKHIINNQEIVINQWLADDLSVAKGENISLHFYKVNENHQLTISHNEFTIKDIINDDHPLLDPSLMPRYPGLYDAGNCNEWDTQIPIDLKTIRKKDEDFWDKYKGAPKAIISYKKASEIFNNPYGKVTSVRFKSSLSKIIKNHINSNIDLSNAGMQFVDIFKIQQNKSEGSVNFSYLFISLGFFIIMSSIIILSLYFILYLSQRTSNIAVMKTLGFKNSAISKLIFFELVVLIILGSLLGNISGGIYAKLILIMLSKSWNSIIGFKDLLVDIKLLTCFISILISSAISYLTIKSVFIIISKRSLINHFQKLEVHIFNSLRKNKKLIFLVNILTVIALIALTCSIIFDLTVIFFIISAFILLFMFNILSLISSLTKDNNQDLRFRDFKSLVSLNSSGNNLFNTCMIFSLSSAIFIIIVVSLNTKIVNPRELTENSSGTGGFTKILKLSSPLPDDKLNRLKKLKDTQGQYIFNSDNNFSLSFVEGEDSSCLNINKTDLPGIMGINIQQMMKRKSFCFSKNYGNKPPEWELLGNYLSDGTIPAAGDESMIKWGLKKSLGDTIEYTNDDGKVVKLKIIAGLKNSILQGSLIIDNNIFKQNFPARTGTRFLLLDIEDKKWDLINNNVRKILNPYGLSVSSTLKRLSDIYSIENTYLKIFMILGGLGIITSTLSVAVIIFKSAEVRKSEFALMNVLGYSIKQIHKIFTAEFLLIIKRGVVIGTTTSVIAVFPLLLNSITFDQIILSLIFIFTILIIGYLSVYISTRLIIKGKLLTKIRND